jgi:hypothetical protein
VGDGRDVGRGEPHPLPRRARHPRPVGELARATGSPDWRLIVGNTLLVWAVAALHHSKVLKGTPVEASLHRFPHGTAPAKAA